MSGAHTVEGRFGFTFPDRTAAELFALAADIESYPRFVPWCIATRIVARHPDHWWCDNLFGAGPIRLRFHTRAEFAAPQAIDIHSSDGPFHDFRLGWRFAPLAPQGCAVTAQFHMVFRWELARLLARASLADVERRIVTAFRARAESLYGTAP